MTGVQTSALPISVACTSDYFDRYNNLPEKLKTDHEPQTVDIDSIADALAERLEKKPKENRTPAADEDKEKQIEAILEDLDLI